MWLYRLNHALGPVLGACFRLRLEGEITSIPRTGGFLVVPNHSSYLDPWMVGMAFPRVVRWLITREWYDRSRTARFIFRAFGTLPVRSGDPSGTIDAVCSALDNGDAVGVFPEGGISESGRIRRFHRGIARMAARSGVPVVPVGVRGAHECLPKHRRIPRVHPVTVVVGRPLRFPGAPVQGEVAEEEAAAFVAVLRGEVARLSGRELQARR